MPIDLQQAIALLRTGHVVAYPTETFFGLGADALDEAAVETLRAIKGRGRKPISVVIADTDMLTQVAHPLRGVGLALANAFWPGPLTLVVPVKPEVPLNLRAGGSTIGVRVSSHPVARALAAGLGRPLTSTSCNRAGNREPTRPGQIDAEVRAAIAGYLEGATPGGQPSTIVDLSGPRPLLLRQGAIGIDRLRRVAPDLDVETATGAD
ncbi:MAG: threonylcarbamoyl-AMP synthase [Deltaproteobacteria bacterium]|nr:threonylcarbamoyl-AMP synthase [Deltaproteobacteria bacterium]